MEAVVKKSKIDEGSSDGPSGSSDDQAAEVEARVVNKDILVRIHCGNQKGVVAKLLNKVETLNMVVITTNVTTFGSAALHITIIAKIDKELSMTVDEIATAIQTVLS